MGIHMALDLEKRLHLSVSGDFNCAIARETLDCVQLHWRARSTPVHADLSGVTQFSPCASVLLVLLLEMLNGDFYLGPCSPDLEAAYVDALTKETPTPNDFGKGCIFPFGKEQTSAASAC